MKRWLALIFVLLFSVSVSVFAAPTDSNTDTGTDTPTLQTDSTDVKGEIQQFADQLAPPKTDYSVAYLSQIFGTVGDVLQSASGQMLGQLFDIFNKGVLVVAALWLGMSTTQIVIRAAQEGSFMGQNKNAPMLLLRVALGFAFLIPSSATGYSLLQDLFMKVVVQGVGLADQTWDAALNYLSYGGELYIPPSTLSNATDIVSNYLTKAKSSATAGNPFIAQIFQDEVCMITSQKWAKQGETGKDHKVPFSFAPVFDPQDGAVFFPGPNQKTIGNTNSTALSTYNLQATTTAPFFSTNADCGAAVDYYWVQTHPNGVLTPLPNMTAAQASAAQNYSYSALKQVVLTLLPAAQAYYNYAVDTSNYPAGADNSGFNALFKSNGNLAFSAILAYVNLMTPYQKMITGTGGTGFSQSAAARGWIMAGSFYWSVEQANSASANVSIGSLMPVVAPPPAGGTAFTDDTNGVSPHRATNVLANSLTVGGYTQVAGSPSACDVTSTGSYPPGIQDTAPCVSYLWSQFVGAQQNNVVVSGQAGATSLSAATSGGFLGNQISNDFGLTNSGAYNPITVLMWEGDKLLTAVVAMWMVAIVASVAIAGVAAICSSTSPGWLMAQTGIVWIKSILMLFSTLLLLPGAILSYYVPLYPFAVFTFSAVGWILMVIEGMAAAPLIAMGVTHPEGHDFLGKGEQALMLILSIFIRPALMVIGLIAGMITSFVAFKMLNSGFAEVLASLSNSNHTAFGNDFLILLSEIMVLVIFGMMTMELIEQCYKLIYQLPNYVLKWIGGPQTGEDYGQMASQIKGAVGSAAGSFKEGMQGMDQGLKGLAKGIQASTDAKEKRKAADAAEAAKKAAGEIGVNPTDGGSAPPGG